MFKKLAVLIAAVAVSAPAFADRGQPRGHGPYARNYHQVQHRPVVHHYRPAPRPVYVVHRAPPQPVVYHHYSHPHTGAALLVGAVIGAAIVHHVVSGY